MINPYRPDLTDHHGRVWTWQKGSLYHHCGITWPEGTVLDGVHTLPSRYVLESPLYPVMCAICDPGRISLGKA